MLDTLQPFSDGGSGSSSIGSGATLKAASMASPSSLFLRIAFLLLLAACAAPAPQTTGDPVVDHWASLAFGSDFTGETNDRVAKWGGGPVLVQLIGKNSDELRAPLDMTLVDLSQLTGLQFTRVESGANVKIYTDRNLPSRAKSDGSAIQCYGTRSLAPGRTITSVEIIIPNATHPAVARSCLYEEIVQGALGLPHDGATTVRSLFSLVSKNSSLTLTNIDREAIKLQMNPAIVPDMDRAEAIRAALAVRR